MVQSRPFSWTVKSERAAGLVAEDRLSDEAIARDLGSGRETISRWRRNPEFMARVGEIVEAAREAAKARGLAELANQIDALNDRWARMRQVVEERAADASMADVPGGRTGLLVRTYKSLGSGPLAQVVEEYAVDTGLLKQFLEHEEQAAKLLGLFAAQKVDIRHYLVTRAEELAAEQGLTDPEKAELVRLAEAIATGKR